MSISVKTTFPGYAREAGDCRLNIHVGGAGRLTLEQLEQAPLRSQLPDQRRRRPRQAVH